MCLRPRGLQIRSSMRRGWWGPIGGRSDRPRTAERFRDEQMFWPPVGSAARTPSRMRSHGVGWFRVAWMVGLTRSAMS